eukprot:CAMPEP_0168230152 /NCGR_PEP_ID=MMETSP0140_2-20121125/15754_1 /TAXON_ID=44445 /ORGANISM="Pseudo-nitzschia australis, Strain 10249 10 AB" /LENGTH=1107 /DNA_ID=CAMNT_0008162207 /DNA_START=48 /DNA_END=3371 /DNA_ORIENTATION=+
MEDGKGKRREFHNNSNSSHIDPMGMSMMEPSKCVKNPRILLLVACLWPLAILSLFASSAQPIQPPSRLGVSSDSSASGSRALSIADNDINNSNHNAHLNWRSVLDRVDVMGYGPTHPRVAFVVVGETKEALIESVKSIFSNTDMNRIFVVCAVLDDHQYSRGSEKEHQGLVKKLRKIENGSVPHWHGLKRDVHKKNVNLKTPKDENNEDDDEDEDEDKSHSPKVHVLFNTKQSKKGLAASRSDAAEFVQILVETHEKAGFKSPDEDLILVLMQGGTLFRDHTWLNEVTPALIVPPPLMGLRNQNVAMKLANAISFRVEGIGRRTSLDMRLSPVVEDAPSSDMNLSNGKSIPTPAFNGAAIAMRLGTFLNLPSLVSPTTSADTIAMDPWLANLELSLNLWLCADGIDILQDVEVVSPPGGILFPQSSMSVGEVAKVATLWMDDSFRELFFHAYSSTMEDDDQYKATRLDWDTEVSNSRRLIKSEDLFKKCRAFDWYIMNVVKDTDFVDQLHSIDDSPEEEVEAAATEQPTDSLEKAHEVHIEPPKIHAKEKNEGQAAAAVAADKKNEDVSAAAKKKENDGQAAAAVTVDKKDEDASAAAKKKENDGQAVATVMADKKDEDASAAAKKKENDGQAVTADKKDEDASAAAKKKENDGQAVAAVTADKKDEDDSAAAKKTENDGQAVAAVTADKKDEDASAVAKKTENDGQAEAAATSDKKDGEAAAATDEKGGDASAIAERKKPSKPLRPINLEIVTRPQLIDISFVDVSNGHQEHPHMPALDAKGLPGYIHDETALRKNPPPLKYPDMKKGCDNRDDHYKMMHNRIVVETEYDKKMEESGKKRDKIFCLVYTIESGHPKIPLIRETWGPKCDGFMVGSTKTDVSIGAVNIQHEGPEEYDNIWQKVRSMWSYIYDNYYEKYDWFHVGGDDLFLIVENLRYYLESEEIRTAGNGGIYLPDGKESKQTPLLLGRRFAYQGDMDNIFDSGGSGYTMNKATLKLLVTEGFPNYFPHLKTFSEDTMVAKLLKKINMVLPYDTKDDAGGERYMPFLPGHHYSYHLPENPDTDWYAKYSIDIKEGLEHCSPQSIAFHYVKGDMMKRLFALAYGLCPK